MTEAEDRRSTSSEEYNYMKPEAIPDHIIRNKAIIIRKVPDAIENNSLREKSSAAIPRQSSSINNQNATRREVLSTQVYTNKRYITQCTNSKISDNGTPNSIPDTNKDCRNKSLAYGVHEYNQESAVKISVISKGEYNYLKPEAVDYKQMVKVKSLPKKKKNNKLPTLIHKNSIPDTSNVKKSQKQVTIQTTVQSSSSSVSKQQKAPKKEVLFTPPTCSKQLNKAPYTISKTSNDPKPVVTNKHSNESLKHEGQPYKQECSAASTRSSANSSSPLIKTEEENCCCSCLRSLCSLLCS